jgi:hypothetical protein
VTLLLIAAEAAVRAPLRYLTDRLIQARHDSVFPWGTFAVNLAGSLLLGLLIGLPANRGARRGSRRRVLRHADHLLQLQLRDGCGWLETAPGCTRSPTPPPASLPA